METVNLIHSRMENTTSTMFSVSPYLSPASLSVKPVNCHPLSDHSANESLVLLPVTHELIEFTMLSKR